MERIRQTPLALAACTALLCACVPSSIAAADRDDVAENPVMLEEVLSRFDKVQASIRTLSADLTMTTVNHLLKEPMVYRGRLYMTKPDALRWEFSSPEEMRFVIANDEYVGYYPAQKRAERKNIRRWSEQLFCYFGLGQGSKELAKFYHIRLEDPGSEMKGTYLLVMNPKKRRLRKRVEDVRFWVDAETLLPVKVKYLSADGNTRVIEFRSMQLNVDLATSLYTVELPPDVHVSTGFSPFGGGAGPGS